MKTHKLSLRSWRFISNKKKRTPEDKILHKSENDLYELKKKNCINIKSKDLPSPNLIFKQGFS